MSATPAITPVAANKKPSPSPSIKRGKVERLLKEHGSPPGIRVTAGGRVVPSDLPPLSNSRFPNNGFKPPPLRGVASGSSMSAQARPDVNNVPRFEVVGSQPVLFVGDRAFALPSLEATSSALPSLVSGVPDTTAKQATQPSVLPSQGAFSGASAAAPPGPVRPNAQTPFAGLDLTTLKAQQTLKKQELKNVEQTEVLQASQQTEAWRAGMIEKKRNLIIELDALRKAISAVEATDNNVPPAQVNTFTGPVGAPAASAAQSSFIPQFQQPMPSPMYAFPGTGAFSPLMMYQPPFGAFPSIQATESTPFVQHPVPAPHSPGSASRRSHAVEIKPPRDENKKQPTSKLDPKSPTYEPVAKVTTAKDVAPPTPSPAKRSSWRTNETSQSDRHEDRTISQKPSLSSIDTTDFFPTNTHEHSSTRVAPKAQESKQTAKENAAVPSTPEKDWPASPWNEGNSSRSSKKAVPKLTSWPEAFGKQPSMSSLKQATTTQLPSNAQERAPPATADPLVSAFSSNLTSRKSSMRRTGTEENWPPFVSKPTTYVPSTYQEGYQAGYDHVGIPDSPEVLRGYLEGLLHFLADECKKGRDNSLRGLVARSTPHDSAVSMSFGQVDASIGNQENARSAKVNAPTPDARRDSVYTQLGGAKDTPITYTYCNEAAQQPRLRNPSTATYLPQTDASDKMSSAYRQLAFSAAENELAMKNQEKGIVSRANSALPGGAYPRQFSGNQTSSRSYGTPVSMQRYIPPSREYRAHGPDANFPPSPRPMANQRLSGLDGAMDDLADVVLDTHLEERRPTTEGQRSTEATGTMEPVEADASCFRPSSSKGKQKLASSPTKAAAGEQGEVAAASPANTPRSPKKSGEVSPAKAKLEQVTNKFRRTKKDPRNMSPEEKRHRSEKWHTRFRSIKSIEQQNIYEHIRDNPRK